MTFKTTHGASKSPEWMTWKSMKQRCANASLRSFPRYGGRGIQICERWRESFADFMADMGPRPSRNHSVERLNNDGNYEPGNCKWATQLEQMGNRRNTPRASFQGETLTLREWAKRTGLKATVIYYRLHAGWTVEDALTRPTMANGFRRWHTPKNK